MLGVRVLWGSNCGGLMLDVKVLWGSNMSLLFTGGSQTVTYKLGVPLAKLLKRCVCVCVCVCVCGVYVCVCGVCVCIVCVCIVCVWCVYCVCVLVVVSLYVHSQYIMHTCMCVGVVSSSPALQTTMQLWMVPRMDTNAS